MPVRLGLERLLDGPDRHLIAGKRVGLVCNPASIDSHLVHASDRLMSGDWTLAALFGPQHGFRSDLQENMIESPHGRDAKRRVPVHSLYSETREPTAEMLAGLDVLVIDLQDVGTRIYTYIYTMANCLRAARKHGVRVVVCDRPNPINGDDIEGATLDPAYESFVGQFAIPMRHGLTIGEAARLFNEHFGLNAPLDVVPMEGWTRGTPACVRPEAGAPPPSLSIAAKCLPFSPSPVAYKDKRLSFVSGSTLKDRPSLKSRRPPR